MFNSFSKSRININPILVFGRTGQVGKALESYLNKLNIQAIYLNKNDCDISDELALKKTLNFFKPRVIINAAAYTDVDFAEREKNIVFAINSRAPQIMAEYIVDVFDGILLHYSTECIFADTQNTAYSEQDKTGPIENLSIYGQSKLVGEQLIEKIFNSSRSNKHATDKNCLAKYYILRTSWVYGDGENFISTVLNLARKNEEIRVVIDQIGAPSSAQWLAEVGVQMLYSKFLPGIYNAVPDGEISRYGLARFAIETAKFLANDCSVKVKKVTPVLAIDCPRPAKRPCNSRLSNFKLKQAISEIIPISCYPDWKEQVHDYIKSYMHYLPKS